MESYLIANGLTALFGLSFLAATVLPIGSEWLLVALLIKEFQIEHVVAVATLGNYLGACTTYMVGLWGSLYLAQKVFRIDSCLVDRAKMLYHKYGSWSLLLSWLPIIGDPLCLVGGALRLNFILFSVLVFCGKFIRYALVALAVKGSLG
ncbi:MAG: DedA family protein [Desulfobulbaceae bacterium]|nr:DedA family protein [Desulfobulbaceae bacterium]